MNLIASTSTFSFFTIISRILGYVRDILIAIFLGTSLFADAFFVAFRLPNTFRRLFAEGAFNAAFIPSYAGALTKDKIEADNFAKNVFNLLFIILLFFVLIAEIFMPQIVFLIAPGFYKNPEKLQISKIKGVSNLNIDKNIVTFNMQGNIDNLIKAISKYKVNNLRIIEPDLEEIFLTYY